MILNNDNEIEISGIENSKTFGVELNSTAFKILTDRIYSCSISAVIRELSCNAYDAHIAAGNEEEPFVIKFPTTFDPYFKIRDYGIGLSEEDVYKIYSNFFVSTKRDSNQFIGALGLGSKTPFAYTDTFTVTSYFNGMKYIFSAFIDGNGTPSIAKLMSEETDEPNGLEIVVAVLEKDFRSFTTKAQNILCLFNPLPDTNIEIDEMQFKEKVDGIYAIGYDSSRYGNSTWYAVQGNISYPIDSSQIQKPLLNKSELYMFFDIGELSFTASRESLDYDQKTLDAINAKYEDIIVLVDEKHLEVKKDLDLKSAYKTYLDLYDNYKIHSLFEYHDNIQFVPNGITFKNEDKFYKYTKTSWTKSGMVKENGYSIKMNSTTDMAFIEMEDKNRPSLVKHIFDITEYDTLYVLPSFIINMIKPYCPTYKFYKFSEIQTNTVRAKSKDQTKLFLNHKLEKVEITEDEIYYIATINRKASINDEKLVHVDDILENNIFNKLKEAKILKELPVYVIPKSELKWKGFKDKKLIRLDKAIIAKSDEIHKHYNLAKSNDISFFAGSSKFRKSQVREVFDTHKKSLPVSTTLFLDEILKLSEVSPGEVNLVKLYMNLFSKPQQDDLSLIEEFDKMFPMLNYVSYYGRIDSVYKQYIESELIRQIYLNKN